MSVLPFVSVIIPCLNEESFIGKCLDSIIANDYPVDRLEVLVVDGKSEDGTRKIVERYAQRYPFIRLLDNTKKLTPCALNIGIKNAKGEIIVRMDAHSSYERNYISKCVRCLKEYNADNVGGMWITVPRNNSFVAKAIAHSLTHPFGVGNAHYRIGKTQEPRWVDTVPYGCYYKEVFKRVGLFDETFPRNEDTEFNARLRKAGGKILLVPEIVIKYYTRSTYKAFCKHQFDNGLKVAKHLKLNRAIFSWRHFIPFIFVLSLIGSAVLSFWSTVFLWIFLTICSFYLLTNLCFSTILSYKEKNIRYIFLMLVMFSSLHISYGLGSIWGALTLIMPKRS